VQSLLAKDSRPMLEGHAMHFGLTEEQQMIVDTTRAFVENELYPHEQTIERTGHLPMDLIRELQAKAMAAGLYAANMPEEVGGAGLDTLTWLLYEKELGRANYALHWTCVARPSNILLAGNAEQREQYLYPCIRGETWDCLAMTEPGAGSDLRGMKASARQDSDDWILNGTKHFISHADIAGFAIVFMATGEEQTPRGPKKKITAFFVDKGTRGFTVREGYRNVSHRGYTNAVLEFDDCRLNRRQILGEVHKGFEVATAWLGATRLQVASTCLGRAERALAHAIAYAAEREQFGQKIGKFQGISFKLADMAMELKAAELLTREAAWKYDQGSVTEADMSMAKLKATEVLAMIADEAIQIHGGMGLMDELPLERIWRDARVERIWEGTSEIQRHIISRELLRPFGA
jgi:alkylation response protein AidB-like acyl-CoA dehydrogenase